VQIGNEKCTFDQAWNLATNYNIEHKKMSPGLSGFCGFFSAICQKCFGTSKTLRQAIAHKTRSNNATNLDARTYTQTDRDYQLLNVPPRADKDTLRTAYRREIMKYHPDKFSRNVGTPGYEPKTQEEATAKSQEITNAYERLKSQTPGDA
jgi:hypothetical protein